MQYLLMFYESPDDIACRTDQRAPAYFAGWNAYVKTLSESGLVRGGAGLQASTTATSLRVRGGERQIHDGPFADTKEQLGGFFLIEVPNLDAALAWAARAPCVASGGVEVRPTMSPPAN
ncbi:MAG: YciI family protein [Gammaproteobacteria bacterium]